MTVGVPSRYFVTAMPSSLLRNLVMEISFSSIKLPTASLSSRKPPMAAYKNLVTDTSFEARYFVIAVSLEERNLVTVTSRNLVTVMSLVSRICTSPGHQIRPETNWLETERFRSTYEKHIYRTYSQVSHNSQLLLMREHYMDKNKINTSM